MSDDPGSRVKRQSIRGHGAHRFVAPKKMYKHVCLRYMSMSPMGGFNVVFNEAWQEEKRHGR
jgi:hypothetical protein